MGESAEDLRNWRGLYQAALFETDTSKIPSRIEEARSALVFRSRELSPIMTMKLRLSRMPSMPCKPWRIV